MSIVFIANFSSTGIERLRWPRYVPLKPLGAPEALERLPLQCFVMAYTAAFDVSRCSTCMHAACELLL
jgi:hypothetical protein